MEYTINVLFRQDLKSKFNPMMMLTYSPLEQLQAQVEARELWMIPSFLLTLRVTVWSLTSSCLDLEFLPHEKWH